MEKTSTVNAAKRALADLNEVIRNRELSPPALKFKESVDAYMAEIERLRELWEHDPEPTATEGLANFKEIYERSNNFEFLKHENEMRAKYNEMVRFRRKAGLAITTDIENDLINRFRQKAGLVIGTGTDIEK